jgi:hypothetical protein
MSGSSCHAPAWSQRVIARKFDGEDRTFLVELHSDDPISLVAAESFSDESQRPSSALAALQHTSCVPQRFAIETIVISIV